MCLKNPFLKVVTSKIFEKLIMLARYHKKDIFKKNLNFIQKQHVSTENNMTYETLDYCNYFNKNYFYYNSRNKISKTTRAI